MFYETMGIDEQAPEYPFVRLFNPSEIDKTVDQIERWLRNKFGFIDLFSLKLWRMLGFDDGPVYDFLYRYMLISREKNVAVTQANLNDFMSRYSSLYPGTNQEDLKDYFDALIDLSGKNLIPEVIYKPYTYNGTERIDDLSESAKKTLNKILLTGAAVAVVYLLGKEFIVNSAKRAAGSSGSVFTT